MKTASFKTHNVRLAVIVIVAILCTLFIIQAAHYVIVLTAQGRINWKY